MADHKHGEMDTTEHEKMFGAFMKFTNWSVMLILALLILMAIFIT
ncbi:MAG: aa3-type cytochrome c oxidase subunit IV [Pseudomonadota bacterium]